MKAEYDLSKMKSRRNPYASKTEAVCDHCLAQNRKIEIKWPSAA
jgi:hypothetical protein